MRERRSGGDGDALCAEVDDLRKKMVDVLRRVDELEQENERLRSVQPHSADGGDEPWPPRAAPGVTRRRLLLGGVGAAAAGGLAAVAGASPASATNGQPIIQGQNNSGTTTTPIYTTGGDHGYALSVAGDAGGVFANVFGSTSGVANVPAKSALRGDAGGDVGVMGTSKSSFGGWFASTNAVGLVGRSDHYIGVLGASDTYEAIVATSDSGVGVGVEVISGIGITVDTISGTGARVTVNDAGPATNGVHARLTGTGVAGRFENLSANNSTAALYGVTSGTGQGVKGNATAGATGVVGTSTNGLGGQFGGQRAAINLIPTKTVGRPTSGTHSRGDLLVDSTGTLYLCTSSGSPGSWSKLNATPA